MQAIILHKTGGTSNLKIEKIEEPKPANKEVVVKHTAIGVNFFDIAMCRGQYKPEKLPMILGSEGCGVITKIGSEVVDFKVGDRVAYSTAGYGSYVEMRAVDQRHLVAVPAEISDIQVAGSLTKGLMAHTLLHRVYLARRAKRVLIHSATGGVGHILCQWAKYLGLEIIGTVGLDAKIDYAKMLGCSHVINYKKQNLVEEVGKITNYEGVGIVYESLGKETLSKSLDCLWPMGMCISYGESSGSVENFNLNELVANSLFITRPTLTLYKASRIELVMAANEVFAALSKKIITPKIKTYSFSEVARAHQEIESGINTGSIVLNF